MDDIFHDTFYTIGMIPENPEVSLYDTIMQDIMDDPFFPDAQFIYEEGIAPGSDIYIKAHDYFYDSLKDYITEEAFHKVVSHRILLPSIRMMKQHFCPYTIILKSSMCKLTPSLSNTRQPLKMKTPYSNPNSYLKTAHLNNMARCKKSASR